MIRAAVVCSAILLLAGTAHPRQPPVSLVRYTAACAACRIQLTKVTEFGSARDSVFAKGIPARDSRGRYFAAADGQLSVLMYDSIGVLRRSFGNPGAGPGEFNRRISRIIVGRGDSVFVFHGGNRVEVFSPELVFARHLTLPVADMGFLNTVAQIEGGLVFEANLSSPDRIGRPIHLINEKGEIQRSVSSVGESIVGGTATPPPAHLPLFAAPDRRSFWVMTDTGFVMQRWSNTGELLQQFSVTGIPWMKPIVYFDSVMPGRGSGPERRIRLARPHATAMLATVDSEGRLWIVSTVPGNGDGRGGHPTKQSLHVFDPRTRTILFSESMTSPLTFISPDHVITGTSNPDGIATYVVWRVSIKGI